MMEKVSPREDSLEQHETTHYHERSQSNISPLKINFKPKKESIDLMKPTMISATPHKTKIGFHLPLLQVTKTATKAAPVKQPELFTLPTTVKMLPTSELAEGNQERVEWMRNFFANVYVNNHPEAASLEDKIERLQRKLGGQPIPLEQKMSNIGDKSLKEKEEKMMKDL